MQTTVFEIIMQHTGTITTSTCGAKPVCMTGQDATDSRKCRKPDCLTEEYGDGDAVHHGQGLGNNRQTIEV